MPRDSQAKAGWDDIVVRDLAASEIELFVLYWHDPANTFLDRMGLDRSRLPSARKMREQLMHSIGNKVQTSFLTVLCEGEPVGVHELTEIAVGKTGTMHAQIWSSRHRGRGIGSISYVKAMETYFSRYKLQTIEFRTPKTNVGANRIKQIIGLKPIADVTYKLPIFDRAVPAFLYRAYARDLPALIAKTKATSPKLQSDHLAAQDAASRHPGPATPRNERDFKGKQHDTV